MDTVIQNLLCPITLSLPVKPVTAEDGYTYDEDAIKRHLAQKNTSPKTNKRMGRNLVPAQNVTNTLHGLLDSGVEHEALKEWAASIEVRKTYKDSSIISVLKGSTVMRFENVSFEEMHKLRFPSGKNLQVPIEGLHPMPRDGARGTAYRVNTIRFGIDWDDGTIYRYDYPSTLITFAKSNSRLNPVGINGLEHHYKDGKLVQKEIWAIRAASTNDWKSKGYAHYDDAGKIARIEYIEHGETEYFEDGKHVRTKLRNGDIDYFEDGKRVRKESSGTNYHYVNEETFMIERADGEITHYDPGVRDKNKCLMRVKTEFKQTHKNHGRVYFYENNRIKKIEMKKGFLYITGSGKWASFEDEVVQQSAAPVK